MYVSCLGRANQTLLGKNTVYFEWLFPPYTPISNALDPLCVSLYVCVYVYYVIVCIFSQLQVYC